MLRRPPTRRRRRRRPPNRRRRLRRAHHGRRGRRTRRPAQRAHNGAINSRFLDQVRIPGTRVPLARKGARDPGVLVRVVPQCDAGALPAACGGQAGGDGVVVVCCLLGESARGGRQREVPDVELGVGDFDA